MKKIPRWSAEKANAWYAAQPWLCGFNYVPANAVNCTAMWMDGVFSAELIDAELALAEDVGFNCVRVMLPFIVWENEPEAFHERFSIFLKLCARRGMRVMPSLFDDCCFGDQHNPVFGPQPPMIDGWYSNAWTPSPGHGIVLDSSQWPRLQPYVRSMLDTYRADERIVAWDLYNEPTQGVHFGDLHWFLGDVTLPLLELVCDWAREVNPIQPFTIGMWDNNPKLNDIILAHSDLLSFHQYSSVADLTTQIQALQAHERPLICTEWLCRHLNCTPETYLPVLRQYRVGAIHWGLVNGLTLTHLPWGHLPGQPVPDVWQHDLYHGDHTPYDENELVSFRAAIADA